MITSDSFSHVLNEIFSDFSAVSPIRIRYSISSNDHGNPEKPSVRLAGVNGFKSVTNFSDYLLSLNTKTLQKIHQILPEIDPIARSVFLKQAKHRVNRVAMATRPIDAKGATIGIGIPVVNLRWGFFQPVMVNENEQRCDEETRLKLTLMTHQYALILRSYTDELHDGIRWFKMSNEYPPPMDNPETVSRPRKKIPIDGTVEQVGAALRLLFEEGVFAMTNKTQLIELFADAFCTKKQPQISAGSLKNHFDSTSDRALDQINIKFCNMKEIIKKFKKKK